MAPDLANAQLDIRVKSPERSERVEMLYRAWRERCPIYLALIKPMSVHTSLEVRSA